MSTDNLIHGQKEYTDNVPKLFSLQRIKASSFTCFCCSHYIHLIRKLPQEVGKAHSIIYGCVIICGVTSRQEFTGPQFYISTMTRWVMKRRHLRALDTPSDLLHCLHSEQCVSGRTSTFSHCVCGLKVSMVLKQQIFHEAASPIHSFGKTGILLVKLRLLVC